ncbi:MAG: ABC transporter ATP-binding protein [Anaerolineales bacterium]
MIIDARHLTKTYQMGRVEVHALRGVSLQVEEGEFVTIMGPSGSGKSTLMNMLGCLDVPTSGTYRLRDRDVAGLKPRELARVRLRDIGFVFQGFNLLPRTRALRQVELPLMYAGVPPAERRRRASEALDRVGLGQRLDHRPDELSGGQQQRVAIARALVSNPSLILADEPTGNLDTQTGAEVLRLFQELNGQGITIVFVTHDPDIAAYSRRIVRLRDGLVEHDEPVH